MGIRNSVNWFDCIVQVMNLSTLLWKCLVLYLNNASKILLFMIILLCINLFSDATAWYPWSSSDEENQERRQAFCEFCDETRVSLRQTSRNKTGRGRLKFMWTSRLEVYFSSSDLYYIYWRHHVGTLGLMYGVHNYILVVYSDDGKWDLCLNRRT